MKANDIEAMRTAVAKWDNAAQAIRNAEQFLEYLKKLESVGCGRMIYSLTVVPRGSTESTFETTQIPHFNCVSFAAALREPIEEWVAELKENQSYITVIQCEHCCERFTVIADAGDVVNCPHCQGVNHG